MPTPISMSTYFRHFLTLAATAITLAFGTANATAQTDTIHPGKWTSKSKWARGWIVYESRHYQIQSQVGKEKAKRLADHMEQMFKLYCKTFPPGKDGFIKKPVKLFKDQASFQRYSGVGRGTMAYYMSAPNRELVGFDTGVWQDDKKEAPKTGKKKTRRERMEELLNKPMDFLGVMSHEGWHQYFHWYVVSQIRLPSWINEGMGDYFYCAVPPYNTKGRKAKVKLGSINEERLPTIYAAVKQNQSVPWKEIIHYSQADYYRRPGLCYAQGWAMCHFLMQHKNKKYRKIIPTFIKLVKDDGNVKNCTKRAFKGIDIDKVEAEWKEWVLAQKLPEGFDGGE